LSKRRTHSPEFKARVAMEAISDRKTIQEIAADHAIGMRDAAHLSVRPDPGEPVEAAVAGGRQRAVHQGHGATASSLPASQGQRSKDQAGLMPSQEVCMPRARHFIAFNFTSAFALAHI
jgi:hypothetical protein